MTHRYPKATVEVKTWCKKCQAETMHNVYGGIVQACQKCLTPVSAKPVKKPKPVQEELFSEGRDRQ
jgi:hypothetical protein